MENSVERKYCTLKGKRKKIRSKDFTKLLIVISLITKIRNKSMVNALILLLTIGENLNKEPIKASTLVSFSDEIKER